MRLLKDGEEIDLDDWKRLKDFLLHNNITFRERYKEEKTKVFGGMKKNIKFSAEIIDNKVILRIVNTWRD